MTDLQWLDEIFDEIGIVTSGQYHRDVPKAKAAIAAKLEQAYDSGLRQFSQDQQKQIKQIELGAQVATLGQLEEWLQQYGYEMHVSHVCPRDSIPCAVFSGRSQKANQIHQEIVHRIAKLKEQLTKEGNDNV